MKILFLILITALSNSIAPPAHDMAIAKFHITESESSLQINIIFDLEDFSNSLGLKTNEVSLENMQAYLDENTSFQFNAKVADLKISEVKIVADHIKIKGSFGKVAQKIKTLRVENHCLTNVPDHSNVIQLDLNDKSRDFRMHEGRTEIRVAY